MLLSLFGGHSGQYLFTLRSVCLDGSEVSNKEVSHWTINPSLNEGAAERKQRESRQHRARWVWGLQTPELLLMVIMGV